MATSPFWRSRQYIFFWAQPLENMLKTVLVEFLSSIRFSIRSNKLAKGNRLQWFNPHSHHYNNISGQQRVFWHRQIITSSLIHYIFTWTHHRNITSSHHHIIVTLSYQNIVSTSHGHIGTSLLHQIISLSHQSINVIISSYQRIITSSPHPNIKSSHRHILICSNPHLYTSWRCRVIPWWQTRGIETFTHQINTSSHHHVNTSSSGWRIEIAWMELGLDSTLVTKYRAKSFQDSDLGRKGNLRSWPQHSLCELLPNYHSILSRWFCRLFEWALMSPFNKILISMVFQHYDFGKMLFLTKPSQIVELNCVWCTAIYWT